MKSIFARYLRNIDQIFPLIQKQKFGSERSQRLSLLCGLSSQTESGFQLSSTASIQFFIMEKHRSPRKCNKSTLTTTSTAHSFPSGMYKTARGVAQNHQKLRGQQEDEHQKTSRRCKTTEQQKTKARNGSIIELVVGDGRCVCEEKRSIWWD